ncbi:response regulator transcription factor [Sphingomonas sp. LB-2]|uniref:response regulator n=1 Tax=Sphingomonas caeni TaxID=2984949 RepID=UPI002230206C|nr:response regulator transcription factor [Sphingomonas caeni]MCW3849049.1 response regulator transcription factor [Sphingomonas caeni]
MNREPTRRIAIIDDDPIVREHLIEIISAAPDLDLAGVAPTLGKARELLALAPDLFLVDIGLPDGSGLDFVPEIKAAGEAKALILTSFGDRETVVSAIRAGADGYLLKDSDPAIVLDGIRVTLEGGAPISAAAAVYLLERLRHGGAMIEPAVQEDSGLTPREVELLQLFARGGSYKESARLLGISPLTVGNHVKSIYRKLAVHSRGEAVYEAVKTGQLQL